MNAVTVLLAVFVITLVIGLPITWSLTISSFLAVCVVGGSPTALLAQKLFGGTEKYTLIAIYFFMLAGAIMQHGGISRRLVDFCKALLGHVTGSLSIVTIVVCMFFAAISGSSIATTAAIGAMLFPELVAAGYKRDYAGALPVVGGTLGIVIPPSIVFVVYGTTTNTSISKLLISGLIPGLLAGFMMCVYAYFYAKKHRITTTGKFSGKELWKSTKSAFWALLMPVIILGGIYSGLFTPTEAAAVSVVYGLIVSMFVYKELKWENLSKIVIASVKGTANILLLIMSALFFGYVLTINNVPAQFAAFLTQFITNKTTFLIASFLLLTVLGMLMDNGAIILIVAPLMYPIAMQYGVDPIHYGCLTVFNLAVGQATPPFGTCLFSGSAVTKVDVLKLAKAALPYLVVLFAAVLLTTLIPGISTFLPNLMK